jgi:hypothetical protein
VFERKSGGPVAAGVVGTVTVTFVVVVAVVMCEKAVAVPWLWILEFGLQALFDFKPPPPHF